MYIFGDIRVLLLHGLSLHYESESTYETFKVYLDDINNSLYKT